MFKNITKMVASAIYAEREQLIRTAITATLGHDNWALNDIKHRCEFIIIKGHKEIFCMDKKPLIEFYPIKTTLNNENIQATQIYKLLYRTEQ